MLFHSKCGHDTFHDTFTIFIVKNVKELVNMN